MKKAIRIGLVIVLIPLLWIGGNLLYGTLTDYSPPETEPVLTVNRSEQLPDSIITLMTWNIGYAGLGQESDFFYDGGTTVRMSKDIVTKNVEGIKKTVEYFDNADIFLLQEVDTFSRRSYYINEYAELQHVLADYNSAFALNYNVNFVPVPFTEPMGKVMGGLACFSRFRSISTVRHQFPSSYAWPNRIYFLDRCFMVQRIPYNNKQLVIIDTHNSAYDNGSLKAAEMHYLKDFLEKESSLGNYVIVGGDWNQHAPYLGERQVPEHFIEGWHWAFDPSHNTNRSLKKSYDPEKTKTQLIDFYLCSPNISVIEVKTIDLGFRYSDHQPVFLRVKLN